ASWIRRISRKDSSSVTSSRCGTPPSRASARRAGADEFGVTAAADNFSISRALACADNPNRLRPACNASLRGGRFDVARVVYFGRFGHRGEAVLIGCLVALG